MIDPTSVAFDFDGVIADTMKLFLDIARDDFHINGLRYDDITSYNLKECFDVDAEILDTIVTKIMDGNYSAELRPISGAAEVLGRLSRHRSPVLFVTARPYPGPVLEWMLDELPLDHAGIDLVTTGAFEAKSQVLIRKHISYFVEDRLETCFFLQEAGLTPIVFKQPWNRKPHPFVEVSDWCELESLIEF